MVSSLYQRCCFQTYNRSGLKKVKTKGRTVDTAGGGPRGTCWGLLTEDSNKDSLSRSLLLKKHERFLPSKRYSRSMKPTQPSCDKHCSPHVPLEREHVHLRWSDGPHGVTQAGGPLWETRTPGLDIQAR